MQRPGRGENLRHSRKRNVQERRLRGLSEPLHKMAARARERDSAVKASVTKRLLRKSAEQNVGRHAELEHVFVK